MKKSLSLVVCFILLIIFPRQASASNPNRFINIVNPVRISNYTNNIEESIVTQYEVMKTYGLSGTWLLTDDVINSSGAFNALKKFSSNQELGIFLEVTPSFSKRAGVNYNKSDSWFRAKSLLLVGYSQAERIKLIDTVFEDFKGKFGYYPTSVGAWWIDSHSLSYIKSKYNITANLGCSDQFITDGYGIWGQYWSLPFYPSKFHSAFPASDINNKLDIVTIQWAPRDPLNGYVKGSLYSSQDYLTLGLDDSYFGKLINLYMETKYNSFGQITVGLEGDLSPDIYKYKTGFKSQMKIVMDTSRNEGVQVVTMKQFSDWYRKQFPGLTPTEVIETNDLLGTKTKVIWYQSPFYRIGITYNYDSNKTEVFDFRTYPMNFQEPYFLSPDKELNLYIRTPSVIDSVSNSDEKWTVINKGLESVSGDSSHLILKYVDNYQINLTPNYINISGNIKLSKEITKSKFLDAYTKNNSIQIVPKTSFDYSPSGFIFTALTPEAMNLLKTKKILLFIIIIMIVIFAMVSFIWKTKMRILLKIILSLAILCSTFVVIKVWVDKNSKKYLVSQEEISALEHLAVLPSGKVVVYNGYCLQCSWDTDYPPAIFANHRNYVKQLSGKQIIYNKSLFNAKTRPEGKQIINSLHAKYIYVARVGDYKEIVPFSPGDLGIKLIYENASSQIWQII